MPKITFIGAGSTVFAKNLLGDILSFPELADSSICLFDIDPERLKTSEIVARRIAETPEIHPAIEATTDRGRALDGAQYAISMIQVGGSRPCTVTDFRNPEAFRSPADDCGYTWHWRHHARAAHRSCSHRNLPRNGTPLS
jgi:alpha-galactosidase